ncbi:hypothetical protein GQ54DRAFT_167317 [Martensiomyces pterosporus]|nr:hypothetical protein GQ54DRAFT_167317 [Martensiomyces pterosporus]
MKPVPAPSAIESAGVSAGKEGALAASQGTADPMKLPARLLPFIIYPAAGPGGEARLAWVSSSHRVALCLEFRIRQQRSQQKREKIAATEAHMRVWMAGLQKTCWDAVQCPYKQSQPFAALQWPPCLLLMSCFLSFLPAPNTGALNSRSRKQRHFSATGRLLCFTHHHTTTRASFRYRPKPPSWHPVNLPHPLRLESC